MRICPFCNRELVLRRSKFGEFYGCLGYPECDYSEPIKKESPVKTLDKQATNFLKQHGFKADGGKK